MDGTCAHLPEMPERASWALRPARWSTGFVVVNFAPSPHGEVVCFAPPGTSLYDERGLATAAWRRGVWGDESEFVGQRPPRTIEALSFTEATRLIPNDFAKWARSETAAHVEALRAFAHRRPNRPEPKAAAARLREELEVVEPGALESCHTEVDVLATRSDLLERREFTTEVETIAPTSVNWRILRRFPMQAALLGFLYGLYRLARPGQPGSEIQSALEQLSPAALLGTLMWVYGHAHVPLSFVFLGWVFFKRHSAFDFLRNSVIATAVITVFPYLFLSAATYAPQPNQDVPANAVPTMPALHLSIGIMVGLWGFLLCRSAPVRLLWLAYPFLTLAVVVASGPQELLLTVAGSVAAVAIGLIVATGAGYCRASWRRPRLPGLRLPRPPSIPHY